MSMRLTLAEARHFLQAVRDAGRSGGLRAADEAMRMLPATVRHQLSLELARLMDEFAASPGPPGALSGPPDLMSLGLIGESPGGFTVSGDAGSADCQDGGLLESLVPGATAHQERRRRATPIRDAVLTSVTRRDAAIPHMLASVDPPPDFDAGFTSRSCGEQLRAPYPEIPNIPDPGLDVDPRFLPLGASLLMDAPPARLGGSPPRPGTRFHVDLRDKRAEETCRQMARDVLEDAGVEQEPVDLDRVAFHLGIVLHRGELGRRHDAVLAHGNDVAVLITNRNVDSEERLRYADAVGMAYALLSTAARRSLNLSPERENELLDCAMYVTKAMGVRGMRRVRRLEDADDRPRRSSDRGPGANVAEAAARILGQELLLPFDLMPGSPRVPSFNGAEDLAEEFEAPISVVLEAMVRRSESACALVISVRGTVLHAVFSLPMERRAPALRAEIGEGSAAHLLISARGERVSPRSVAVHQWFESLAGSESLTEHSRRMGDDVVYTVLSLS